MITKKAPMFCPKCGCEYREGFWRCADCDVALVAEPPTVEFDRTEWQDMAMIRTISDPAFLLVAKSVLQEAGIPYWTKNEGLQDLIGLGRIGTGFNVMVQPVELRVPKEDVEEANRLLDDVESAERR